LFSRFDFACGGTMVKSLMIDSEMLSIPGFEPDHCPMRVRLALRQERKPTTLESWSCMSSSQKQRFRGILWDSLASLDFSELGTQTGIWKCLEKLTKKVKGAIKASVPRTRRFKQHQQKDFAH
jgi:hypothetical protein